MLVMWCVLREQDIDVTHLIAHPSPKVFQARHEVECDVWTEGGFGLKKADEIGFGQGIGGHGAPIVGERPFYFRRITP